MELSPVQRALLDRFQRDFPVGSAPYADAGRALGLREDEVLAALRTLVAGGIVARVAPIFRTGTLGASTLAAMAVPRPRLADVARIVSGHAGVNHNYAREHRFNLWFVAHARDEAALDVLLHAIDAQARVPAISLPLVREYHIDLGFPIDGPRAKRYVASPAPERIADGEPWRIACALEQGLPLVPRPFAEIAQRAGVDGADGEARVRDLLQRWLAAGAIRRCGLIVRHRPLGFTANVMAVWELPERDADRIGKRLAPEAAVTLCYRRAPAPPQWRYNLFCMLHGRSRDSVGTDVDALVARHGLAGYPHARLWSIVAYKQTGARHDDAVVHG